MACPNEQPDREIEMTEFPTARAAIAHYSDTGELVLVPKLRSGELLQKLWEAAGEARHVRPSPHRSRC